MYSSQASSDPFRWRCGVGMQEPSRCPQHPVQSMTAVASTSTRRSGSASALMPSPVIGGTGVTPSFSEARAIPSPQQAHLVGAEVDDVEGQLRYVVERAANCGQCGADVEVALLDLGG